MEEGRSDESFVKFQFLMHPEGMSCSRHLPEHMTNVVYSPVGMLEFWYKNFKNHIELDSLTSAPSEIEWMQDRTAGIAMTV